MSLSQIRIMNDMFISMNIDMVGLFPLMIWKQNIAHLAVEYIFSSILSSKHYLMRESFLLYSNPTPLLN
jgi:hypothetical protein